MSSSAPDPTEYSPGDSATSAPAWTPLRIFRTVRSDVAASLIEYKSPRLRYRPLDSSRFVWPYRRQESAKRAPSDRKRSYGLRIDAQPPMLLRNWKIAHQAIAQ